MPHLEVHPQGLLSNYLWKIDDIFIAEFGKRKICYMKIGTYSGT